MGWAGLEPERRRSREAWLLGAGRSTEVGVARGVGSVSKGVGRGVSAVFSFGFGGDFEAVDESPLLEQMQH